MFRYNGRMSIKRYGLLLLLCVGCDSETDKQSSPEQAADAAAPAIGFSGSALAEAVGAALERACEPNALEDTADRDRCADTLSEDATLAAAHGDTYLRWGAQAAGAGYDVPKSNTTLFDPFVWRRLYLSTFAFPGGHSVEALDDGRFVLHVPVVFRNELDAGEYPYPFWHSQPKWESYERTRELLFFFERDAIAAVLRSEQQDAERPHSERVWDGQWYWDDGEQPRVALFSFLFSKDNPHTEPLDKAYRAFSEKQREAACESCHNPSNPSKINPLEFFNYPNQALTGRHDIVEQLTLNKMPPTEGIADTGYREELLALARTFADVGDKALEFEAAD
jgi:hypothetical protein